MAAGLQGMDTIPKAIFRDFKAIFDDYLPGFSADGIYNYALGAETAIAAEQAGIPMHLGSHPEKRGRYP
jgi:hypothetical protein